MMTLEHPVARAVGACEWLGAGETVLAAVSGGPDSMAMLHALYTAIAERADGTRVVVAHLDHHMRDGSHRDRIPILSFADARGLSVCCGDADVPALARARRESLETAARHARYAFLRETASSTGARWIATAHTRSDHVETVLMRILRGSGDRGLAGIPRRRDGLVRPLLDVLRAHTHDYCEALGVPFVVDPTNADRRFTRNAIRHEVLPELRRAFPGIDDTLVRMAERAERSLRDARAETAARLERHLVRDGDAWVLHADAFDGLDDDTCAVLLGDVLADIGCVDDVRRDHYTGLLALALAHTVGRTLDLPGARARREHDGLVIRPAALADAAGEWRIEAASIDAADALTMMAHAGGAETVAYLAIGEDTWSVRSPRAGDRMQPFGMRGHKKLSDLFVDRRVPFRRRAGAMVVESGGEIVWVPGVAQSERTRVTPASRSVVRLTAVREADPA